MTQPAYEIHSQSSLNVQAIVLPRAQWERERGSDGRLAFRPQKGTWYGHVVRGKAAHDVFVVAMVGCPSCAGLLLLSHSTQAAKWLGAMLRQPSVPVAHSINHLGKVSPDMLCGRCEFHRTVYLDRWNKTKPLFALAYVCAGSHRIEIAHSHSIDIKEARFHLGPGNYRILAGGPAVGFFVDEKTGRMTAE